MDPLQIVYMKYSYSKDEKPIGYSLVLICGHLVPKKSFIWWVALLKPRQRSSSVGFMKSQRLGVIGVYLAKCGSKSDR